MNLKDLLKVYGIQCIDLAKGIGMKKSTLSNKLSRKRRFTISEAQDIYFFLHENGCRISVDRLISVLHDPQGVTAEDLASLSGGCNCEHADRTNHKTPNPEPLTGARTGQSCLGEE